MGRQPGEALTRPDPTRPPSFVPHCFSRCCFVLRFFFSLVARPRCLWLSLVSGTGCPGPWLCVLFVLLGSRSSALCALSPLLWFLTGRWLLPGGCCPPPPLLYLTVFLAAALCSVFFSLLLRAPVVSGFLWFPALAALGLGAVCCFFLAFCSWALRALPPLLWFPPGRSLLPGGCCLPPPLCVSRFLSLLPAALFFFFARWRFSPPAPPPPDGCVVPCAAALCCPSVLRAVLWCLTLLCCGLLRAVRCLFGCLGLCCAALLVAAACCAVPLVVPSGWVVRGVPCCAVCPWVRCCAALLRVVPPGVVLLCTVLFCCTCLVSLIAVPCPQALPVALGACALRRCVLWCSPTLCAVCCVCFVVARWCALLFAVFSSGLVCGLS